MKQTKDVLRAIKSHRNGLELIAVVLLVSVIGVCVYRSVCMYEQECMCMCRCASICAHICVEPKSAFDVTPQKPLSCLWAAGSPTGLESVDYARPAGQWAPGIMLKQALATIARSSMASGAQSQGLALAGQALHRLSCLSTHVYVFMGIIYLRLQWHLNSVVIQ